MIGSLFKKWYGDFSPEELKKYVYLGITFALLIGTYWTLRPLKDSIFGAMIIGYGKGGARDMYLGWAKIVSLILLFPLVIGYSKLVDKFRKHRLFYVLGLTYAVLMLFWALFFLSPTLGLANTAASPWRIGGWLWYVFVESFGSIMIALFWAFTVDISDEKSAKRGFSLVVMIGQIGGILLPMFLTKLPRYVGTSSWLVVALCAFFVCLVILMIRHFVATIPQEQLAGYKSKAAHQEQKEPGFLDGLKLLVSHRYLLGIFAVISFFELISTFIDFNFKTMAFAQFGSDVAVSEFLGAYASSVNTVAFLFLLFGINNIQHLLGIRTALALVPLVVGSAMLTFFFIPQLSVLYWLMVGAKAINYALNSPSLKQLYIPTTEDAKYKSQAWIETFGSRSAKAGASSFNILKSVVGVHPYMLLITGLSVGMSVAWFFIALALASRYTKAIKEGSVVC